MKAIRFAAYFIALSFASGLAIILAGAWAHAVARTFMLGWRIFT
jgi:hypothetical protein